MNAPKVDVLAILDAEITDLCQISDAEEVREYVIRQREAVLREARAAVAELIEAATDLAIAVSEETAFLAANHFRTIAECDEQKKFENRVIQATERLAAAIARVGGDA